MKNFNLLQIVPSLESGGVEQGTLDLAKGLFDSGYKSFVVSNGGIMVSRLEKYGVQHFKLPMHSKNIFTMYLNIKRLKKIIFKNNISIMHVRSRAPAWSAYFCKSKNIKLVSTFHNIYGHQNLFKKKYNQILAKGDKIIAISDYVKKTIMELYNINAEKITVISRGIDTKFFDPSRIKDVDIMNFLEKNLVPFDKKIILFPGRLSEWKGQIDFIKTLKQLKNKNFFCLFAGDDRNKNYAKKLNNTIYENNLGHMCKILGNQKNMPLIYKLSHIVVSAPLKGEGFGRIVSEAMAMKKLVVAYDFGGVKEQIKDLSNISHVIPLNRDDLLRKIEFALQIEDEEYKNLTSQSNEIVLKEFSKEQMINKTIQLYQSL